MTHWTQEPTFKAARSAGIESLEYWMYHAACYVVGCTREMARDIAAIAMREGCGIWHAAWLYRGSIPGQCGCAKCHPYPAVIYDGAPTT